MDLNIVRFIQSFRNPVLDWFFYIITQLGDQYAFILIAAIIYWTINKKFAHRFIFAFILSAALNSGLKQIFQRERPFYYQGVSAEPSWITSGYAFPSGHAQAAGVLGYTAIYASHKTNKKWLNIVGILYMILIPLSRVYLGQHFLTDVIVGVLLAFLVAHLAFKLIDHMKDEEHIYTLMLAPLFLILMLFIRNHDLYIAAGGFVGFALGYYIEKRYVAFDVKATLGVQIIKVIFGILIALTIKEGFKFIFPDRLFFDFLRYLLIGVWAAVGAPYVFKYGLRLLKKDI